MKRILSVALSAIILCLCFSACGKNTADEKPEGTYFMLSRLPEKSVYKSQEVKKYFYRTGALDSFEAGENYGGVVPCLCSVREFKSKGGTAKKYPVYAVASVTGKLITLPCYTDVSSVSSSDGRVFYICRLISRNEKSADWHIISADGKTLIPFSTPAYSKNTVTEFLSIPCECFAVPDMEKGISLYDFDGKEIINMTETFGADCYFNIFYCDGKKIIFNASSERLGEPIDDNYFCINTDGDLLYTLSFDGGKICGFAGGYFIVEDGDSNKKLSDVLGNIVTGKRTYKEIVYDKTGKSFWCRNARKKEICRLGENGKPEFSQPIKNISEPTWSFLSSPMTSSVFVRDGKNPEKYLWFTVDGEEKIKLDTKKLDYFGEVSDEKYDYIAAFSGEEADIYDASGTYITTIENIKDYYGGSNGKIAYRDKTDRLCIKSLKAGGDIRIQLDSERADDAWVTDFTGDTVTVMYNAAEQEESEYMLYSLKSGQPLAEGMKYYSSLKTQYGNFFTGVIGQSFVLLSPEGERLVSIFDAQRY